MKNRSPAYLWVGRDGRLIDWGGKLSAYGIKSLQKGELLEGQVVFLNGLLLPDDAPLFLSCVKAESGLSADIHLFSGDEGVWILMLDATPEEIQRRLVHQKSNELSLLRHELSKVWKKKLGKHIVEKQGQDILTFEASGERRDVTVLFADIREFTSYTENKPPRAIIETLNQYLRAMIQPIPEEAGLLDKIIGDAVMAIFGILPTIGSHPNHAINAALRMLENVKELNEARRADRQSTFDIAIGIASGPAVLGIFGRKEQRTLSVIGKSVNLAARLERQATRSQILIDENTFGSIKNFQAVFSETTLRLKNIDGPLQAFSYEAYTCNNP